MNIDLNNSIFIELDKENNIFVIKNKDTNYAIVTKLIGIIGIDSYTEKDNNQIKNILTKIKDKL